MLARLLAATVACTVLLGLAGSPASAAEDPTARLEVEAYRSAAGVTVQWTVVEASHGWTGAVVRRTSSAGTTQTAVEHVESLADPGAPADASYTVALVTTAGETAESARVTPTPSTDGLYFSTTPADGSGHGIFTTTLGDARHGVRADLSADGLPARWVERSPTGDRLATTHRDETTYRLYVRDSAGALAPRLVATFAQMGVPTWSPDGTRLAVLVRTAGSQADQLALVPADGSAPVVTGTGSGTGGWLGRPTWWPDARSLVLGDETGRLLRLAAEPGARLLETLPYRGSQPTISPDGDWIARTASSGNVAVSRLDGSQLGFVPHQDWSLGEIWSPDGRSVAGHNDWHGTSVVTRAGDGTWGEPDFFTARASSISGPETPRLMSWSGAAVGIGPTPVGSPVVPIDTRSLPAGTTLSCTVDGAPRACGTRWDLAGVSGGLHRLGVTATEPSGRVTVAARDHLLPGSVGAGGVVPLPPTRLLDTRAGTGAPAAAVGATSTLSLQVTGRGGVPATGVAAVVLNVTAVSPAAAGYLTAFPEGSARPGASNLNFTPGRVVPNVVTVPVGRDGRVALFNGSPGPVHLLADVAGYVVAGAGAAPGAVVPLAPARLLDTRGSAAAAAMGTTTLQVTGKGGVPSSGVSAVLLNVTAVAPTRDGFVTVHPTGAARPTTSNLNFRAGDVIANLVVAKVGTDGTVALFNGSPGSTHLLVDVAGFVRGGVAEAPGSLVAVPPQRILDTRTSESIARLDTRPVDVAGSGGVPWSGVSAVVLNVTVVDPGAGGYLTAYPHLSTRPTASNLNFTAGQVVPGLVVVKLGPDGRIALFNGSAGATHVLVDVAGYVLSTSNGPR